MAGALAAPTSWLLGPLLASTGAAAGDAARQFGAKYFDPTPGATPYNVGQTAGEAVGAGIGQLAGAGLLNTFAPARLGIKLADLSPDVMARAENVNRLAQGMGVDSMTPGMLSGVSVAPVVPKMPSAPEQQAEPARTWQTRNTATCAIN